MNADMTTTYLGLQLTGPIVAGASPLTGNIERIKELADAGAAAIVLPSLFEEQIEHDEMELYRLSDYQSEASAEASGYYPIFSQNTPGSRQYVKLIQSAKSAVKIPVIASLNGCTPHGWGRYAKMLVDAGADALELNIYFVPTDPQVTSAEVERRYLDLVEEVRSTVSVPIAIKMGPFITALPHFILQLEEVGANGFVIFNRYLEPEIDIDRFQVQPHLELSSPSELRLPLRWIAILREYLSASLAATSGLHSAADVIKALMVGADVTMLASTLLVNGSHVIHDYLSEIETWMIEHEYKSLTQLRGCLSRHNCENPSAYERANYLKALTSFSSGFQA